MTYIMSCVWPDYMVKYFQSKNCEGSSPTDKKCTASFLVPVYIKTQHLRFGPVMLRFLFLNNTTINTGGMMLKANFKNL